MKWCADITISKELAETCMDALQRSAEELTHSLRYADDDEHEVNIKQIIDGHQKAEVEIRKLLDEKIGMYLVDCVKFALPSLEYGRYEYPDGLIGRHVHIGQRFFSFEEALRHIANLFEVSDFDNWITNVGGIPGNHTLLAWFDDMNLDERTPGGVPVEIVWHSPYSETVDGLPDQSKEVPA